METNSSVKITNDSKNVLREGQMNVPIENSDCSGDNIELIKSKISLNTTHADLKSENETSSKLSETSEDYVLVDPDIEFFEHDKNLKSSGYISGQCGDHYLKISKFKNFSLQNKKSASSVSVITPTIESASNLQKRQCSNKNIHMNKNVESSLDSNIDSKSLELLLLHRTDSKNKKDSEYQKLFSGSTVRVSISNNLPKHNAVTYSKISSATNANIFSRNSVNTTHKNHPIVVTTKKLVSEITQTTAKVSIGNTTISVPLLKPIISSHIISNDASKYHSQIQNQNQKTPQQPIKSNNSQISNQVNSNKPKILNIKRGQKLNSQTIVSLSQLQMKPAAGKIVQATVVGKKLQLPKAGNDLPLNSSSTGGKNDVFYTFPFPKTSQLTVVKEVSSSSLCFGDEIVAPTNAALLASNESNSQVVQIQSDDYYQKNVSKNKDEFINMVFTTGTQHKMANTSTNAINKLPDQVSVGNTNDQTSFKKNTSENISELSSSPKTTDGFSVLRNVSHPLKTVPSKTQGQCYPSLIVSDFSLSQIQLQSSPYASEVNTEKESREKKACASAVSLSSEISSVSPLTKNRVFNKPSNEPLHQNPKRNSKKIQSLESINFTRFSSVKLDSDSFQASAIENKITTPTNLSLQTPLKRSKSTDDGFDYEVTLSSETSSFKKNASEVPFSKRSNSLDTNVCCSALSLSIPSTLSNFNTLENGNVFNDAISNTSAANSLCIKKLNVNDVSRNDEEQNVLLKKLLQNSNNQTSTTICNQTMSGRKVINVRAPSLGLVSSLEAQLARPAIPPVPTATSILSSKQLKSNRNTPEFNSKQTLTELNEKSKQCGQKISKETSFVSKLNPSPNSSPTPTFLSSGYKNTTAHTNKLGISITSLTVGKARNSNFQAKSTFSTPNNVNNFCNSDKKMVLPEELQPEIKKSFVSKTKESYLNNVQVSTYFKDLKSHFKDLQTKNASSCISANYISENLTSNDKYSTNNHETDIKLASGFNFSANELEKICDDQKKEHDCKDSQVKLSAMNFSSAELVAQNKTHMKQSQSCCPQETELRKKRKREYQKHRRQLINNKDPPSGHSKKRPRKMLKIEEDYDSFIDSLMSQMRQMPSLQVLEPLLNKNFSICTLYGAKDLSKISNSKEYADLVQNEFLLGEFGSGRRFDVSDFYSMKPFGSIDYRFEHDMSIIQNDFYDQEFASVLYEDEIGKLHGLINSLKETNVEMTDNIIISSSYNAKVSTDSNVLYTGKASINDHHSCIGRMSPVIPVIMPFPIKSKFGLKERSDLKNHVIYINENDFKNRKNLKPKDRFDTKRNLTVVLTLSLKAADNVVGVLCDLASILNLSTLGKYKPLETASNMGVFQLKPKFTKTNNIINDKVLKIQKIINGTSKMCQICANILKIDAIQINSRNFNSVVETMLPKTLYFCSEKCYAKFKTDIGRALSLHENFPQSQTGNDTTTRLERFLPESPTKNCRKLSCAENLNRYKFYDSNNNVSKTKVKKLSEKEIIDNLFKMNITVVSNTPCNANMKNLTEDTRQCVFCGFKGDGVSEGSSRLLNFDVDKWVHLNCALWSNGVYETISGGLMNLEMALQAGLNQTCSTCRQLGATIKCFKNRCGNVYHLPCAISEKCLFYKNKTVHCFSHALKIDKDSELSTLSVPRRVYVERDESRQVAAVMHHSELTNLLRVGSLTFLSIGQLLPHQLEAFHTPQYIYPIGYKIIRFYWSMRNPNKRCRYVCSIAEVFGRPEFRIQVQETLENDIELRDSTPKAVWQKVLEPIATLRKENGLVQLFSKFITGEDLFGLTEPAIVRILESLPGIETLTDYHYKYGRNFLLELPLAINPSGSARSESKQKQIVGWRKPRTQRTASISNQRLTSTTVSLVAGEVACPYSKQFVHSKSSQYKKMKQEWRNNVYLARSKIQGLGLYAARDLEKHTMVIEYIGEVIRTEVSELREKQYEAKNRGIYMFRLDEDRVVDATLSGGLARYINHSCNPNCVTEIVDVDREYRIIIFAKRRVNRGEELSYDYKFDIEDDAHKIPCTCAAPNCRKWMN